MKAPRETDLVKQCLRVLALYPDIFAFRNNTGALSVGKRFVRFGKVGAPDIIGWIQCRGTAAFLGVEVKLPGRHPTEAQEDFLGRLRADGGCALIVHDLKELTDGITAFRRSLQ